MQRGWPVVLLSVLLTGCSEAVNHSEPPPETYAEGHGWVPGYSWTWRSADGSDELRMRLLTDALSNPHGSYWVALYGDPAGDEYFFATIRSAGMNRYHQEVEFTCEPKCASGEDDEDVSLWGPWTDAMDFIRFPLTSGDTWKHSASTEYDGWHASVWGEASVGRLETVHSPYLGSIDAVPLALNYTVFLTRNQEPPREGPTDRYHFYFQGHWSPSHSNFVRFEAQGGAEPATPYEYGSFLHTPQIKQGVYWLESYDLTEERLSHKEIAQRWGTVRGSAD